MGHQGHGCRSVSTKIWDKHMAIRKKDHDARWASKVRTKHAAVEEEELSVASITLEDDGMPSREEMFKAMCYQGMNVALSEEESDGKYEDILNGIGMSNHFSMGSDKWKPARLKLYNWKLYLDSCATYHSVFAEWYLKNIQEVELHLKGHCNIGVTTCKEQGYYGVFKMWVNCNGIANLLSIPQLEEDDYVIDYNTKRDWLVTTPQGDVIRFKRDTGLCNRMLYTNLCESRAGVIMLETVRKKSKGFTKKQVKKAILAREIQVW